MKKYLTLQNIIFVFVIVILLLLTILSQRSLQKTERTAITFMAVSQIRSGLSAYRSERGEYPIANKIVLGSSSAKRLCLGESNSTEGFLSLSQKCNGTILTTLQPSPSKEPFVYNSTGAKYTISFSIPKGFGVFKEAGSYCATQLGLLVGKCR